ncbi:MAG: SCP2 sterol-binding domain-containing protein [Acidimicrobiales bacterium]
MARFLSPQWLDDAAACAAASPELAGATVGVRLRVQQVVTGGPDGEVRYSVSINDGQVELCSGFQPDADVTFVADWATAVAMATGTVAAQEAFTTGRLQVRGDIDALLRHGPALVGLDAVFASVREQTTY